MASLAERITKPEGSQGDGDTADRLSSTQTNNPAPPASELPRTSSSWADEAEDDSVETGAATPAVKANAEEDMSGMAGAQTDGASERLGGEIGVIEPSYEVEIKLADIQANPNDPLYSIKSFEQLGL